MDAKRSTPQDKRLAEDRPAKREPIAVIGLGCRFPGGASNPTKYWELLSQGQNAIRDIPPDRWDIRRFYDPDPDKPGKTYARQAGFLTEKIDMFDPMFFGISPREAQTLDPQQRLLLEVVWESLEDAGLQADGLAGSNTGVFIGGFAMDMNIHQSTTFSRDTASSYTATGTGMTLLANRISYVFDFRGPSVAMDTACSSSLVTTHYACQSLWNHECTLALAGGCNVMLRPEYFVGMSKGRYLSPHARCMSFDARADGYARGEGCGLVVLKPLSAALRDQDPIYALIRATGVNQDGQTVGISLPNQDSQEKLIAAVYRQAGISPGRVQYIEAHGTGTKAGDPIEARALDHVLSVGRKTGEKCIVGSVKTNIGHLEAAAGVAGLIKAILCLKRKQIPPNLNYETPNPDIGIESMCIRIPTELEPWPENGRRAYAGVNSFGYGGTNAHVLLEEAPARSAPARPAAPVEDRPMLIPLSARGPAALQALAERYRVFLSQNGVTLRDFCYSATFHRSHLSDRAALVAGDRQTVCESLRLLSGGDTGPISNAVLPAEDRKMVFVYTGMGPQWWGMGRELVEAEPVFRESLDRCDALFSRLSGWSLLEALGPDEDRSQVGETRVAQPANLAIQIALTDLWKSWGIVPDAVVGHSVGEIAAAYAAGVLSLEDAIFLGYHRSRLQQTRAGSGAMLAVGLSRDETEVFLQGHARSVSVAAINSPSSVTLSGKREALEQIARALDEKGVFHRFLRVEVPYHSPEMNPIRDALKQACAELIPRKPQVPLYSTVIGSRVAPRKKLGATYWWKNARDPVLFSSAMQCLIQDGHRVFLEIGPHPVLRNAIGECLKTAGVQGEIVPSLHRDTPELPRLLQSLGTLYTFGITPNWKNLVPENGTHIPLPTYPWQRESCWFETEASRQDRLGRDGHVFLSTDLKLPTPAWEVEANDLYFPYLQDHRIDNAAVFPGAAYVDAGLALHRHLFPQETFLLEDLEFHTMLVLDPKETVVLHLEFDPETRTYTIHSRPKKDGVSWTHHATGRLLPGSVSHAGPVDLDQLKARCPEEIQIENFYAALGRSKFYYGPYFQNIEQIWVGPGRALARIEGHPCLSEPHDYLVHPILLDASFQLLTLTEDVKISKPWVPVSIGQFSFHAAPPRSCWAYVEVTERAQGFFRGNIQIFDENGRVAVDIKRMGFQEISAEASREPVDAWRYRSNWVPVDGVLPRAEARRSGAWLVCGEPGASTEALLECLAAQNIPYLCVSEGDAYTRLSPDHVRVSPDAADFARVFEDHPDLKFETVVYLAGSQDARTQDPFSDSVRHCGMVLALVRALPQARTGEALTLGLVTAGAQAVLPQDEVPGCGASPLWGFGRVIRIEYPNIDCRLLDLDGSGNETHIPMLVDGLLAPSQYREAAYREGRLYFNRIERAPSESETAADTAREGTTRTPVELHIGTPGRLDSLAFRETRRTPPGPGEVEIRVHASSLNFKDILKAMGTLSAQVMEDTYVGTSLGLECSGVVIAVGEGVRRVQVGDEVVATTRNGSFRSYVTAPETYVIRKPTCLSLAEAPIFTVFLTAYYGLVHVARLQKGERVLIHNASGGVGLAAIQVARWIGAEVFATAGTDEKRDYLKAQGIRHVMDSRSLDFAEEVRASTGGKGVDVVLNAMFGEALFKSFELLAPYGRFVEIGKKDIVENSGLPMETFNRNVTFSAIDLDRIFEQRPKLGQQLFQEICQRFEEGDFQAPHITTFPASDVSGAFRYMAQSKHIGKIALLMEDQEIEIYPAVEAKEILRPDGTYLITGGTRGVGLEMAKWLVSKGVRNLVLISRSGAVHDEATHATMVMKSKGVRLKACAVDVTDAAKVQKLFAEIEAEMPPIRGVIHGAMVLQDGLITGQTAETFRKVLAPKVLGALNLQRHLTRHPLDFFVMCSSISALFGNMGQANYAAANAFLDSFAPHLRAEGLPAITVNWGALAEVGIAARIGAENQDVVRLMEASGIRGIPIAGVLEALEIILEEQPVQLGVFDLDWRKWEAMNPGASESPMIGHLIEQARASVQQGPELTRREGLVYKLSLLAPEDRHGYLESLIAEELSKILQLPASKITVGKNILTLGVDSLMIVELRTALQSELGLELSAMDLMRGLSVTQMANLLLKTLEPDIERISTEDDLSGEGLDQLLESALDTLSPEERGALLETDR